MDKRTYCRIDAHGVPPREIRVYATGRVHLDMTAADAMGYRVLVDDLARRGEEPLELGRWAEVHAGCPRAFRAAPGWPGALGPAGGADGREAIELGNERGAEGVVPCPPRGAAWDPTGESIWPGCLEPE